MFGHAHHTHKYNTRPERRVYGEEPGTPFRSWHDEPEGVHRPCNLPCTLLPALPAPPQSDSAPTILNKNQCFSAPTAQSGDRGVYRPDTALTAKLGIQ